MKSIFAFALSFLILQPCSAFSQDGNLDLTFGRGGKVATDLYPYSVALAGLAVQADGKIIAAGSGSSSFPAQNHGILVRYDTRGELDPSFGVNGKVFGGFSEYTSFVAMAIQPDGKIVVLGTAWPLGGFLVRYNNDGTLDTAFSEGTGNIVLFPKMATTLTIQSDGKIVVALESEPGRGPVLVRYNSDGTLDSAFGAGGRLTFISSGANYVSSLTVQRDGKIVAAGTVGPKHFALARYDNAGTPDPAFGVGGIVLTDILAGYEPVPVVAAGVRALSIQADGKIVAAGRAVVIFNGTYKDYLALVRYNSSGTVDTTFGAGGRVITEGNPAGLAVVVGLAIQADGKIVMAGAFASAGGQDEFRVARYNVDGTPDETFGYYGIANTSHELYGCTGASSLAIQPDGKILAAGPPDLGWTCTSKFAIARFTSDASLPVTGMQFEPMCVRPGGSLVATFSGPRLADDTYFDVRFLGPGIDREETVLNWQQGTWFEHILGADATPGTWTVTAVRAHRGSNPGSGGFIPLSASVNVSSSCAD